MLACTRRSLTRRADGRERPRFAARTMVASPTTMSYQIGIIGDFNSANRTHQFTNQACEQLGLRFRWVPTDTISDEPATRLAAFDGVWIAPASPYRSMDGALEAIRYARKRGVPLVGT